MSEQSEKCNNGCWPVAKARESLEVPAGGLTDRERRRGAPGREASKRSRKRSPEESPEEGPADLSSEM